jgi:ornithine decarboxylase
MMRFEVKTPPIPIPFHKFLKVVALVDPDDPQTKALLENIAQDNFEIEISDPANVWTGERARCSSTF